MFNVCDGVSTVTRLVFVVFGAVRPCSGELVMEVKTSEGMGHWVREVLTLPRCKERCRTHGGSEGSAEVLSETVRELRAEFTILSLVSE